MKPRPLAVGIAAAVVAVVGAVALAVQPAAVTADPNVKAECPGKLRNSANINRVTEGGEREKRTPDEIVDAVLGHTPGQAALKARPKQVAYSSASRRDIVVPDAYGATAAVFWFTDTGNGLELDRFHLCSTVGIEEKIRP